MAVIATPAYRKAMAEQLGQYAEILTSDVAQGPDPQRWIVSKDTGHGDGLLQDTATGRWIGGWAYVVNGVRAGTVRRVAHQDPASGSLWLETPFSTALTTNVALEVTSPLPALRHHGVIGLLEILNMALRDLWVPDRLDLTTTTDRSYSLSTYAAWLTSPDQLIAVYDPPRATGSVRQRSRIDWRLMFDGGTPFLEAPLARGYGAAGATFQVEVRRPAHTLINSAESSAGLVAESSSAQADLEDVVTVGLLHAYRWLSGWRELPPEDRQRYADLIPEQEAKARRLPRYRPQGAAPAAQEAA